MLVQTGLLRALSEALLRIKRIMDPPYEVKAKARRARLQGATSRQFASPKRVGLNKARRRANEPLGNLGCRCCCFITRIIVVVIVVLMCWLIRHGALAALF